MSCNSIAFAEWGNKRCRRLVALVFSIRSPFCFEVLLFFLPLLLSFCSICPQKKSFVLLSFFSCLCSFAYLAHVLFCGCFSFRFFVLSLRFLIVLQEMKIYSLLTRKNEKRKNTSRFSFIFAVEQFNKKTQQSFILKHTML